MMAKRTALLGAAVIMASGACGQADAHVVLSQLHAAAGAYYTAYLRVGHGCDGAATTSLRVEISPETPMVRAQPKPGWTLKIEHAPFAVPGEGGRMMTERVSVISWTGGSLPDAQWDEFGISVKLPTRVGPLYFPVVQTCERGEERWVETPGPGQPAKLAHPAPVVTLEPAAAGGDAMAGMKMGG